MSKKFFISDDAPAELKETIAVAQRMADNMQKYKAKADNGTLTFADLDDLTRRNNAISKEFPRAQQPVPGYPVQTRNMNDLEALSKSRLLEAESQLKQQGGPVYKITSFDQLKELSKMPPAAMGQVVLDSAKVKREKKEGKKPEVKIGSAPIPKRTFHASVYIEHLAKVQTLLYNAKTIYYYLPYDWENAELFEDQLMVHAKSFEDFKEEGVYFLLEVLRGEDSEDDVKDLKGEAAFVLATIETEKSDELDELIGTWKIDEELKLLIVNALKYGKSSRINPLLEKLLLSEMADTHADFIDILAYRNAINPPLWEELRLNQEPAIEEKIIRAYINVDISFEKDSFALILEDEDAPFYEEALFSGILNGDPEILIKIRKIFNDAPKKMVNLPLIFSCGCRIEDYSRIKQNLEEEKSRQSAIRALGLLGMGDSIPLLIRSFSDNITSKEDWDIQKSIAESLELITGVQLELSMPDIIEGPEEKEYEVKVTIDWKEIWARWWMKNSNEFDEFARYRRGKPFELGSCLDEMQYERGNYWTRQYSYYEFKIRTGKHIAPFYADWYVAEQKASIDLWKKWWEEKYNDYPLSQWLFAGKQQ